MVVEAKEEDRGGKRKRRKERMKLFDWDWEFCRGVGERCCGGPSLLGRALLASAAGVWGPLWLVLAPLTLDRLIYAKQG